MEDYSKQRNKPSTQRGYQGAIDRRIVPLLGRVKVQDVKRPDVATVMKKMAHKPAEANRAFSVMRKMFNLAEGGGSDLTVATPPSRPDVPKRESHSSHQRRGHGSYLPSTG